MTEVYDVCNTAVSGHNVYRCMLGLTGCPVRPWITGENDRYGQSGHVCSLRAACAGP